MNRPAHKRDPCARELTSPETTANKSMSSWLTVREKLALSPTAISSNVRFSIIASGADVVELFM